MSYCRWSSDASRCDLYCYEDVNGGYTTHVASKRRLVPDELIDPLDDLSGSAEEFGERYREFNRILESCELVPIDLPHAGESFNDPDLESFRDRLLHLREVGYRFPDYVIDVVNQEIDDDR